MPINLTGCQNHLLSLANETESALEDIFLSGFSSIRPSTLDRLEELLRGYQTYGMQEGVSLLEDLIHQLKLRKESFESDVPKAMTAFSRVEFYLEHLQSRIEQE